MAQKVNIVANVGSVALTPLARIVRTVFQIVVSIGLAIPIILNTPGVSGNAVIVKDLTILGGLVATVTAIMNALEGSGLIPVIGGKPAAPIVPALSSEDVTHQLPKAPYVL